MPPRPNALNRKHRQVINAAVQGNIDPVLSQDRKTLYVRTPQGRVSLEITGQGLTAAGREYYRRRGIRWHPRTVAGIDYERAGPERTARDGMQRYIVAPDGKCLARHLSFSVESDGASNLLVTGANGVGSKIVTLSRFACCRSR